MKSFIYLSVLLAINCRLGIVIYFNLILELGRHEVVWISFHPSHSIQGDQPILAPRTWCVSHDTLTLAELVARQI